MREKRVYEGVVTDIGQEELWNHFLAIYPEIDDECSVEDLSTIYISVGGRRRIGEHPLIEALSGKRVRVTIEEITDGERV